MLNVFSHSYIMIQIITMTTCYSITPVSLAIPYHLLPLLVQHLAVVVVVVDVLVPD